MKLAWMYLSGLALAYLALRFGDQLYLQQLEPWIYYAIIGIGVVAVGVAIGFFVINNTVMRNDRRAIGFSNAGLFCAMSAVVVGAFAYGAIVQPVFHQWGIEPWNWVGKGNPWENVALYAIGLLIVLILQHFWIAGLAYMRSRYKKSDAYTNNQVRIYNALDDLGKKMDDFGAVATRCLKAIEAHDKVAGGKVTDIKDVLLPQLAGAIDHLTDMVNKRLPPLADEAEQTETATPKIVQPQKHAA